MTTITVKTALGEAQISSTKWWDYSLNDHGNYSLFHQKEFMGQLLLSEDQVVELVKQLNNFDIVIDLT